MDDARYRYGASYIPDFGEFRRAVLAKTVVPYQVEFHPGPAGSKLCWLSCPYCYGGSAEDTGERIPLSRWVGVLDEVAAGGVRKVVFAGYGTDPLHYHGIEDLLATAIQNGTVFGINTKALHVRDLLVAVLACSTVAPGSWISVSVDAGSDEVYDAVHGITSRSARLYSRVRENVARIAGARGWTGARFDVAATYLVTRLNANAVEARQFVEDFRGAGCNVLRFAFPQTPRGRTENDPAFPSATDCAGWTEWLYPLVAELDSEDCHVLFVNADQEHDLFRKARTLPCVARFVYPTVGFDGWLYPCSQSAAPNFRGMALGNLAERGFWECYYDYDPAKLEGILAVNAALMDHLDCRCDRKEHLVNLNAEKSGVFQ